MKLDNTCDIITKNTLNETDTGDIAYAEQFIGDLIKEGYVKSSAKEICYTVPLRGPIGYVYGSKKVDDTIKIIKTVVEVEDHITKTEITKEAVDDIMSQFQEYGVELITDLIKRDLFVEQDKDLFKFINNISKKESEPLLLTSEDFEAALVRLQGLVDEHSLNICSNIKAPTGSVIIGSPKVVALLIREDNEISRREDKMYSFAGSLGNRLLFVDYDTEFDYITVGVNGSDKLRGAVFCPYSIQTNYNTKYSSGESLMRINNRYKFVRNPIDIQDGVNNSLFFTTSFIDFGNSLTDVQPLIDKFNS